MSIGTILVGIALLIGVVAYVARPLFTESSKYQRRGAKGGARAGLTTRRDAVYALIRELDVDFQTGKVNAEDYQALRERYVAEGVSLLKQLDALSSEDACAALEAEIEARVSALRQARSTSTSPDLQPTQRFCTQCGHAADPIDRFCAQCGASLKGAASQ